MPSHTHPIVLNNDSTGTVRPSVSGATAVDNGATNATGGGGAHNNLQPSIALNYIIKT